MGYLDSKGLERAAWVTKNYAAQNWQMTKSKEWEVSFCPAPQTELEPIVDFMFTETPPSNGEPKSPTNPSTINGVSSLECSYGGKNLLYYPLDVLSKTINGVTFTYDNGVFTANGTSEYNPVMYRIAYSTDNTSVYSYLPAGTYTLSGCPANGTWNTTSLVMLNSNGLALLDNEGKTVIDYGSGRTFTIDEPVYFFVMMRLGYAVNTEVSNIVYRPQLEIGSTATSFEAAHRTKVNISLGNTYYGGSLNVKTGELTVTHTCISFDGTETWDSISGYNSTTGLGYTRGYPVAKDPNHRRAYEWFKEFSIGNASINDGLYSCSHFPIIGMFGPSTIENGTITKPCMWYTGTNGDHTLNGQCRFAVPFSDISDFKAWLAQQNAAGTPLTVVYRINEPYTVQLTPQQILSLPQEDKYTPRINTVYTDQKSVRVGYKRLDCIELRSDQTVHGEKTFADSPLVPNPDDLESQQAAPISFVKDMLRAEVEAMSGGKNTIIRDQWNNPHVMVRIPKFLLKDIDSSWPNEPHPAFIVNGVQKSEIFIGKYLASKSGSNRVQTLPRMLPWGSISYDDSLAACRALGNGFCLNTNANYAARVLWLHKTLGGSHEYLGNRDYGRDATYFELTGTMKNNAYIPGNTGVDGVTLTGSGGIKWIDDETAYGIDDLVGNVWEWNSGFRVVNSEIQIIPNNNAALSTCDMSSTSTEWKAVLQDGSLVAPGTTDTIKYGNANIGRGYFHDLYPASNATVPDLLKELLIFPNDTNLQGALWYLSTGECISAHGGCYFDGHIRADSMGPFALSINRDRSYTANLHGFRTAYVA